MRGVASAAKTHEPVVTVMSGFKSVGGGRLFPGARPRAAVPDDQDDEVIPLE